MERMLRSSKQDRARPIVEGGRSRPPLEDDELECTREDNETLPEEGDELMGREDEVDGAVMVEGVEANNGKRT